MLSSLNIQNEVLIVQMSYVGLYIISGVSRMH
jgi:hypothetical protein